MRLQLDHKLKAGFLLGLLASSIARPLTRDRRELSTVDFSHGISARVAPIIEPVIPRPPPSRPGSGHGEEPGPGAGSGSHQPGSPGGGPAAGSGGASESGGHIGDTPPPPKPPPEDTTPGQTGPDDSQPGSSSGKPPGTPDTSAPGSKPPPKNWDNEYTQQIEKPGQNADYNREKVDNVLLTKVEEVGTDIQPAAKDWFSQKVDIDTATQKATRVRINARGEEGRLVEPGKTLPAGPEVYRAYVIPDKGTMVVTKTFNKDESVVGVETGQVDNDGIPLFEDMKDNADKYTTPNLQQHTENRIPISELTYQTWRELGSGQRLEKVVVGEITNSETQNLMRTISTAKGGKAEFSIAKGEEHWDELMKSSAGGFLKSMTGWRSTTEVVGAREFTSADIRFGQTNSVDYWIVFHLG